MMLKRLINHLQNPVNSNSGFTLIEVIAVLVLTGILSSFAGMGLVQFTKGYLLARENMELAAKAQHAFSRLSRELQQVTEIRSVQGNKLVYTRTTGEGSITGPLTMEYDAAADAIRLDEDTLIDNVSSCIISREDSTDASDFGTVTIKVEFSHVTVGIGLPVTLSVTPRNLYSISGDP